MIPGRDSAGSNGIAPRTGIPRNVMCSGQVVLVGTGKKQVLKKKKKSFCTYIVNNGSPVDLYVNVEYCYLIFCKKFTSGFGN